jgi:hypothetical protein
VADKPHVDENTLRCRNRCDSLPKPRAEMELGQA